MTARPRKTVLVIGGVARSLTNFRGPLLERIAASGHAVHAAAGEPDGRTADLLAGMGVAYHPLPLARKGRNPLADARLLLALARLIRRIRPDVVLAYTIKPVVYGCRAARWCGVEDRHALITGLGHSFSSRHGILTSVVRLLYRGALSGCRTVFFQNPDDARHFHEQGLADPDRSVIVNGSGVDLEQFAPAPAPDEPVFLMIARLIEEKGAREFFRAAERIKASRPEARFLLVGREEPGPHALDGNTLRTWRRSGVVEVPGPLDDVRPALRACAVFVLPSYYREGLPRTLLEALAVGRPVITTDTPGCRETVRLTEQGRAQRMDGAAVMEGENGLLVRARDDAALESAMRLLLDDPARRSAMGRRSRAIATECFDVHHVNRVMMEAMQL